MFCTNCGKQLVDGAYACPYCGNVVQSSAAPQAPVFEATPVAQPTPDTATPQQPQYNPYTQPQYQYTPQYTAQPAEQPVRTLPMTILGFIFAFAFSPVGLILSLIAKSKMKKDPSLAGCKGLNKAGIILSIIFTALGAVYYTFIFVIAFIAGFLEGMGELSLLFSLL